MNAIAGPERLVLRTPASLYGEDLKTVGEFAVEAGQSVPFVLSYGPSFRDRRRRSILSCAGAYRSVLAPMERSVSGRGAMDGNGETVADHFEGFDLRSNGRDRRRRHHLASGVPGRREELGLSLLLVAGCDVHAVGLHAARIL